MQIYKSKASQNTLVQLFFSETNLTIGITLVLCMPMYLWTSWHLMLKAGITLVIGMSFGMVLYQRFDGKPLISKLLPFLSYLNSKRNYTPKDILTMSDYYYTIANNVVFTERRALTVIQLLPPDVSILNESEKQSFQKRLGTFLHTLSQGEGIQILVVNRLAKVADYQEHIDDLINENIRTKASEQIMGISQNYLRDFEQLIQSTAVPFRDYYLIIAQKIGLKPPPESLKKYLVELERKTTNMSEILISNDIDLQRLVDDKLTDFYTKHIKEFS
jgi:hypothetical protein